MKVTLMEATSFPEEVCGAAAAVCTDSKNPGSALLHALESGHTSVLEHAVFTFKVEGLSRAALAQLTRHRLASFDVQSQRYVKLDNWKTVIPDTVTKSGFLKEVEASIRHSMALYQHLLDAGVPAEDARYVTPQAVTTSLRTCNRAQWEIRRLADEMLKICMKIAPGIFRFAGPGCVTGSCPEKKPCGHPREKGEWDG